MGSLRARLVLAAVVTAVGVTACSSGGDDSGATLGSTLAPGVPTVPALPPPSAAGTGVVVVGGTTSSFAVTSCRLQPDPAEPEGARALVALAGAGTTGSGAAFTVELQRFATGTDVVTFTDTVTYSDTGRILQAQRIEVNGQVTDLRDPKAASALVRPRSDGVTASGLASGPGEGTDDGGLIGLALDATC
jgi:hypothetical protein